MKRLLFFAVSALIVGTATAQSPDSTTMNVTIEGGAAVPTTTIVPVGEPPVKIVDTTYIRTAAPKAKGRRAQRARQGQTFAMRLDSLIRSQNFLFYPDTMQEIEPSGIRRNIYAQYFYLGIFTDSAEVHLPTSRSSTEQVGVLNFDSPISDWKIMTFDTGWSITFRMLYDSKPYFARLVISSVTGEAVLTLVTPKLTMRYIGQLTRKRRFFEA